MKNTFVLLTFLSFWLVSCKKNVDELPPATETGANTFGAKVNGEFWVPQGFGIMPTAPILEARFTPGNNLFINARNFGSSSTETEFEIYLQGVNAPGTYLLNANTAKYPNQSANYAYYIKRRFTPKNEWMTTASYTGVVNITKVDIPNKIVSGTFQFTGINLDGPSEPLNVTEGRFDIKTY